MQQYQCFPNYWCCDDVQTAVRKWMNLQKFRSRKYHVLQQINAVLKCFWQVDHYVTGKVGKLHNNSLLEVVLMYAMDNIEYRPNLYIINGKQER